MDNWQPVHFPLFLCPYNTSINITRHTASLCTVLVSTCISLLTVLTWGPLRGTPLGMSRNQCINNFSCLIRLARSIPVAETSVTEYLQHSHKTEGRGPGKTTARAGVFSTALFMMSLTLNLPNFVGYGIGMLTLELQQRRSAGGIIFALVSTLCRFVVFLGLKAMCHLVRFGR